VFSGCKRLKDKENCLIVVKEKREKRRGQEDMRTANTRKIKVAERKHACLGVVGERIKVLKEAQKAETRFVFFRRMICLGKENLRANVWFWL
jgi:hypothetical protein